MCVCVHLCECVCYACFLIILLHVIIECERVILLEPVVSSELKSIEESEIQ